MESPSVRSHRWTFVRYFGTKQVPIGMPGQTDRRTDRQTDDGQRTMSHNKSPWFFWQEDLLRLFFSVAMATRVFHGISFLSNFGRASCTGHSCNVSTNLAEWIYKKLLKEIADARTDGQTMDDRQWAITKAHFGDIVLRWAKDGHTPGLSKYSCIEVKRFLV